MRKIRYGIFETNSSSTHAIVVPKEVKEDGYNAYDSLDHDYGFGREECRLCDNWDEKLAYAYMLLKDNIITYNHDGAMIKLKLLENKIFFERENKDVKIYLEFEKNKSIITKYIIKDMGIEIKLESKTKNIIINDNNLMIEYDLFMNGEFSDSFKYELEWSDL